VIEEVSQSSCDSSIFGNVQSLFFVCYDNLLSRYQCLSCVPVVPIFGFFQWRRSKLPRQYNMHMYAWSSYQAFYKSAVIYRQSSQWTVSHDQVSSGSVTETLPPVREHLHFRSLITPTQWGPYTEFSTYVSIRQHTSAYVSSAHSPHTLAAVLRLLQVELLHLTRSLLLLLQIPRSVSHDLRSKQCEIAQEWNK
jgi:hypothetical protein